MFRKFFFCYLSIISVHITSIVLAIKGYRTEDIILQVFALVLLLVGMLMYLKFQKIKREIC